MNFRIEHPRLLVGALCVMVAFLAVVIQNANDTLDRANIELAFCRQTIFGTEVPPIVTVSTSERFQVQVGDSLDLRMLAIEAEQRRVNGQQNDLERRVRALEDNFLFEAHCQE